MPWAKVGVQTDGEGRLLDAFMKLKKMRMAPTDAYPNYFDDSLGRKCSDAFHGKKETAEVDFVKFLTQHQLGFLSYIGKEPQSEMKLIFYCPADSANARIEINQDLPDGFRRIDRDEKPA